MASCRFALPISKPRSVVMSAKLLFEPACVVELTAESVFQIIEVETTVLVLSTSESQGLMGKLTLVNCAVFRRQKRVQL